MCQSVRRNFFSKNGFFKNGSKPCSRGRYRYYDQFAVSIALRSFFWIWFIMKRVAGRPLYQPDQPGLWWSLNKESFKFIPFGAGKRRSEGFPLAAYSIPGRNGTWAWTPGKILLGAPSPPPPPSSSSSPLEGYLILATRFNMNHIQKKDLSAMLTANWS